MRFIEFIASGILIASATTAHAERVHFDSAARDSSAVQVFEGKAEYTDHIYGELRLPSRGAAPFPAMVIMHSSRGIDASILDWAALFNAMGIATLVVDSFTPRGLSESSADRLAFSAGVVDALRALSTLRQDPRIDPGKIGVIGFSRGAIAAMHSSFERYRSSVLGTDGGSFSMHIVFHGGCAQFAKTTGSPILIFLGADDDFISLEVCRKDTEILNRLGSKAELVVYEGALHSFDTDYPRQVMPRIQNFKNCRMLQNLDTFDTVLVDGRTLSADERTQHAKNCPGYGAVRGGNSKFASAARERVRLFVAEHFKLPR